MWNHRWVGHLICQHLPHISDKSFPCGFTPLETVPQIPEILEISGTWWWIKIRWQNQMNKQVIPGSDYVRAVAQVDVQFVVSGRTLRCHQQGISQVPGTKEQNLVGVTIWPVKQISLQANNKMKNLWLTSYLRDNVWCAKKRVQHVEGPRTTEWIKIRRNINWIKNLPGGRTRQLVLERHHDYLVLLEFDMFSVY